MRAGALRHKITLQARGPGRDALNKPIPGAWVDVTRLSGDVEPLSARQLELAKTNRSEVTHTVVIRYQARFSNPLDMAKMRILYGSRIFQILGSIDPGEAHEQLNLSCREGINDG